MNSRLIWNIEIDSSALLTPQTLKEDKDELRWESRFFWPADEIITLYGLDHSFLALTNYEIKHHEDCYFLLTDYDYNIKQRHGDLVYKPLLQHSKIAKAYGKKINLNSVSPQEILPGTSDLTAPTLLRMLDKKSFKIKIVKDVLTYKFLTQPKIKLEIARLAIKDRIYYSICVEGRSQKLVNTMATHLLRKQIPCDYVSFLKPTLAL